MRLIATVVLTAATLAAQSGPVAGPIVGSAKGMYAEVKDSVLRTAQKIPADLYSYQPTPEVRTFAQLLGHEADGQYEFCSAVTGKPVNKNIEKTVKNKEGIIAALKDAFAYCDGAFATMTEADAVTVVNMFGQKITKVGAMDANTSHTNEHYGNLVTYMRLKGIVPPSSEPRK
jgi:uncharacterized damage-inducible protein DinB